MKKILIAIILISFWSCSKKLDLKPDSTLVLPESIQDMENLLDNTEAMNSSPALAQLSADEYFIRSLANWQALFSPITRTTYIWDTDIFQGQSQIQDWSNPYQQIFYCNSILDILEKQGIGNDSEKSKIKGWALFSRAYAFYNLASTFAKAYDPSSAGTDLGIPLKLTSGVTELVPRSSVQQTYDHIIKDVFDASELLQQNIIADKRNRPSKVAAYALLARVYLSMRKYDQAELFADKAMKLYPTLIDYNTLVAKPTGSSFTVNSPETIFFSQQYNTDYGQTTFSSGALYGVDTALIALYTSTDIRKKVYFRINPNGNYAMKGINNSIANPFTGLATDEMYLIKAECLARRSQKDDALKTLNTLLITRFQAGSFVPITANSSNDALDSILLERRKELIWRCLRWTDLKRLNLEGRNIVLTRNLGGKIYKLNPNSPRYVMPIPDDEVTLSGIQQNIR